MRENIDLPESFDDGLAEKPAFHAERANEGESGLTADEYREIRYKYCTMVSRVDDYVGQVLDTLEAQGLRDDTVILFTSDHGDMQGAHGMNKKGTLAYEELLRVPLIVDIPGFESEREVVDDLVSNAAIPATLVETAGLDIPRTFEGGSLLDAMERTAPLDDERVFFEHKCAYWGHHPYRGVRTREWKFVEYLRESEVELYNLETDPHEMKNLASDPEHESTRIRLQRLVEEFWNKTGGDGEDWITSPTP